MSQLYFAYGSNLDLEQMARRCASAIPLGPATLADVCLAFAGRSRTWGGGGVATLLPAPGASVFGLLWSMTWEDWENLDRAEGVPSSYQRVERVVHPVDGAPQRAWVYIKPNPKLAPPSEAYRDVIARGYARMGFPAEALQAAVARSAGPTPGSRAP